MSTGTAVLGRVAQTRTATPQVSCSWSTSPAMVDSPVLPLDGVAGADSVLRERPPPLAHRADVGVLGVARFGKEARGVDAPRDLAGDGDAVADDPASPGSISDSCTARRPGAGASPSPVLPRALVTGLLEVEVDLEPADVAF